MISHEMARAIANVFIFLDFSGEDAIDEDAAVEAMEQLAGDLKQLDPGDIQDLVAAWRAIADTYQGERREFVRTLAEDIGLVDDEDD